MIVLKKIDFLRPLLVHAAMLTRFSEEAQREQLSVSAQKAVWATSIIKTIRSASLPTSLRDPPLCDVILNLPDPSKEFHFDRDAKNEVMKLFTEGIQLASPFLAQESVQEAQQNDDSLKLSDKAAKKFIFYPNRSVTTHMFKWLPVASYHPYMNYLLTGGCGISKTVSIILYTHLSYHQTRFKFQASKDKKKKEEYNKIVQLGLIPKKVVKYWYWSVRNDTTQQIKKLILAQAVELKPAVRAELMKQPQLRRFIFNLRHQYYNSGLFSSPIVDQVNKITELMKRANQKREANIEKIKNQALQLYMLFQSFLEFGYDFTLISSVAIEMQLMKMKWHDDKLSLNVVTSPGNLQTICIPYEETMLTTGGQLDFWQTFWFEIERRAILEPAQLQSAKQTFFQSIQRMNQSNTQKLKSSTLSVFSRFVYIGEFLSTNYSKLMESMMSKDYQKVQEIIKDFHPFGLRESKQKLISFLQKGETEYKEQILLKLYFEAFKDRSWKNKDQYRYRDFSLFSEQLDEILNDDNPSRKTPQARIIQKEAVRSDLKSLITAETNYFVQFIFNPWEFTTLIEQIGSQENTESGGLIKSYFKKIKKPRFGISKADLGFDAERHLIKCLFEKASLSFNAYQKPKSTSPVRVFNIYQVVPFDQLENLIKPQNDQNQKEQYKSAVEWHFRSAISIAMQNPGKDILAHPYIIERDLKMESVLTNPAVDFVILKYQKQRNMFQFESFDVTVSYSLTNKLKKARVLFNELFEGATSIQGIPFSLNHTYLCQKVVQTIPLTVPLNIWYADITDLNVMSQDLSNLVMFNYIIKQIKVKEKMIINHQYSIHT